MHGTAAVEAAVLAVLAGVLLIYQSCVKTAARAVVVFALQVVHS